ncbi:hypothetical protein Syun_018870 [Stephania yunnanensis]|uniref:Uncharacterized protein n=1 Tax=Stephania yunnanensis TaxID=152371 RepID=A0AAP0NW72_9MAGN
MRNYKRNILMRKNLSEKEEYVVLFLYDDGKVDPIFFEEDFDNFDDELNFDGDGQDFVEDKLVFGDDGFVIEPLPLPSILRAIPDWADGIKERRMQQRRSLYRHENWVEHRSSLRHLRHLLSSLSSRVILSLIPPVIAFTSFAAFIATYNSLVVLGHLPDWLPVLRASSLPYQLTAPALALLLVFRTEASYSRFEEGRKAWTRVSAGTSDFARLVVGYWDEEEKGKRMLLQYVMAFPVALKCHLTYGSDIGEDLKNLLEEDDLNIVLSSKHRPRCIIEFISQSLKLLPLEDSKKHVLESKISCFHEGIAVCEQIVGIPIPLSYTRLTSRFLVLWHLTLPIILWDDCHWIVVPATFISAASLFCIEEVGVLIEEPFPMLALDEVCKVVHDSIQEAISMENGIRERIRTRQKHHNKKITSNGHPNLHANRE